jgi:hypothetical protein
VDAQALGHRLVDRDQELPELGRAVLAVDLADDGPVGDAGRGEKGGDAVPDIVVVRRSGMPGIIGSTGDDRSSAWIWLFSSTHPPTAFSGGLW